MFKKNTIVLLNITSAWPYSTLDLPFIVISFHSKSYPSQLIEIILKGTFIKGNECKLNKWNCDMNVLWLIQK